ncbi:unnamed protein product [Bemisia tabaci]|uniref:Uncharacterized protein n=1 Tax=Bemisia tabaci TaxID=7038 RepID=A0A9P0ALP3_BEMTA|nr:unnamed protein product [Bemisia tabaci]
MAPDIPSDDEQENDNDSVDLNLDSELNSCIDSLMGDSNPLEALEDFNVSDNACASDDSEKTVILPPEKQYKTPTTFLGILSSSEGAGRQGVNSLTHEVAPQTSKSLDDTKLHLGRETTPTLVASSKDPPFDPSKFIISTPQDPENSLAIGDSTSLTKEKDSCLKEASEPKKQTTIQSKADEIKERVLQYLFSEDRKNASLTPPAPPVQRSISPPPPVIGPITIPYSKTSKKNEVTQTAPSEEIKDPARNKPNNSSAFSQKEKSEFSSQGNSRSSESRKIIVPAVEEFLSEKTSEEAEKSPAICQGESNINEEPVKITSCPNQNEEPTEVDKVLRLVNTLKECQEKLSPEEFEMLLEERVKKALLIRVLDEYNRKLIHLESDVINYIVSLLEEKKENEGKKKKKKKKNKEKDKIKPVLKSAVMAANTVKKSRSIESITAEKRSPVTKASPYQVSDSSHSVRSQKSRSISLSKSRSKSRSRSPVRRRNLTRYPSPRRKNIHSRHRRSRSRSPLSRGRRIDYRRSRSRSFSPPRRRNFSGGRKSRSPARNHSTRYSRRSSSRSPSPRRPMSPLSLARGLNLPNRQSSPHRSRSPSRKQQLDKLREKLKKENEDAVKNLREVVEPHCSSSSLMTHNITIPSNPNASYLPAQSDFSVPSVAMEDQCLPLSDASHQTQYMYGGAPSIPPHGQDPYQVMYGAPNQASGLNMFPYQPLSNEIPPGYSNQMHPPVMHAPVLNLPEPPATLPPSLPPLPPMHTTPQSSTPLMSNSSLFLPNSMYTLEPAFSTSNTEQQPHAQLLGQIGPGITSQYAPLPKPVLAPQPVPTPVQQTPSQQKSSVELTVAQSSNYYDPLLPGEEPSPEMINSTSMTASNLQNSELRKVNADSCDGEEVITATPKSLLAGPKNSIKLNFISDQDIEVIETPPKAPPTLVVLDDEGDNDQNEGPKKTKVTSSPIIIKSVEDINNSLAAQVASPLEEGQLRPISSSEERECLKAALIERSAVLTAKIAELKKSLNSQGEDVKVKSKPSKRKGDSAKRRILQAELASKVGAATSALSISTADSREKHKCENGRENLHLDSTKDMAESGNEEMVSLLSERKKKRTRIVTNHDSAKLILPLNAAMPETKTSNQKKKSDLTSDTSSDLGQVTEVNFSSAESSKEDRISVDCQLDKRKSKEETVDKNCNISKKNQNDSKLASEVTAKENECVVDTKFVNKLDEVPKKLPTALTPEDTVTNSEVSKTVHSDKTVLSKSEKGPTSNKPKENLKDLKNSDKSKSSHSKSSKSDSQGNLVTDKPSKHKLSEDSALKQFNDIATTIANHHTPKDNLKDLKNSDKSKSFHSISSKSDLQENLVTDKPIKHKLSENSALKQFNDIATTIANHRAPAPTNASEKCDKSADPSFLSQGDKSSNNCSIPIEVHEDKSTHNSTKDKISVSKLESDKGSKHAEKGAKLSSKEGNHNLNKDMKRSKLDGVKDSKHLEKHAKPSSKERNDNLKMTKVDSDKDSKHSEKGAKPSSKGGNDNLNKDVKKSKLDSNKDSTHLEKRATLSSKEGNDNLNKVEKSFKKVRTLSSSSEDSVKGLEQSNNSTEMRKISSSKLLKDAGSIKHAEKEKIPSSKTVGNSSQKVHLPYEDKTIPKMKGYILCPKDSNTHKESKTLNINEQSSLKLLDSSAASVVAAPPHRNQEKLSTEIGSVAPAKSEPLSQRPASRSDEKSNRDLISAGVTLTNCTVALRRIPDSTFLRLSTKGSIRIKTKYTNRPSWAFNKVKRPRPIITDSDSDEETSKVLARKRLSVLDSDSEESESKKSKPPVKKRVSILDSDSELMSDNEKPKPILKRRASRIESDSDSTPENSPIQAPQCKRRLPESFTNSNKASETVETSAPLQRLMSKISSDSDKTVVENSKTLKEQKRLEVDSVMKDSTLLKKKNLTSVTKSIETTKKVKEEASKSVEEKLHENIPKFQMKSFKIPKLKKPTSSSESNERIEKRSILNDRNSNTILPDDRPKEVVPKPVLKGLRNRAASLASRAVKSDSKTTQVDPAKTPRESSIQEEKCFLNLNTAQWNENSTLKENVATSSGPLEDNEKIPAQGTKHLANADTKVVNINTSKITPNVVGSRDTCHVDVMESRNEEPELPEEPSCETNFAVEKVVALTQNAGEVVSCVGDSDSCSAHTSETVIEMNVEVSDSSTNKDILLKEGKDTASNTPAISDTTSSEGLTSLAVKEKNAELEVPCVEENITPNDPNSDTPAVNDKKLISPSNFQSDVSSKNLFPGAEECKDINAIVPVSGEDISPESFTAVPKEEEEGEEEEEEEEEEEGEEEEGEEEEEEEEEEEIKNSLICSNKAPSEVKAVPKTDIESKTELVESTTEKSVPESPSKSSLTERIAQQIERKRKIKEHKIALDKQNLKRKIKRMKLGKKIEKLLDKNLVLKATLTHYKGKLKEANERNLILEKESSGNVKSSKAVQCSISSSGVSAAKVSTSASSPSISRSPITKTSAASPSSPASSRSPIINKHLKSSPLLTYKARRGLKVWNYLQSQNSKKTVSCQADGSKLDCKLINTNHYYLLDTSELNLPYVINALKEYQDSSDS